jgi:hypothetical protein
MVTRLILRGVAAMVLVGALSGAAAKASDPYCQPTYTYQKVVCYKTVTCYETRNELYQVCVTKYDHCGNPYQAYETRYRAIQVPVYKQVAYTKYVKVPAEY